MHRDRHRRREPQRVRRPKPPALCRLDGDRVVFQDKVNAPAALDAVGVLSGAKQEGITGITLDFALSERAYPEAMMQIVAHVDHLRHQGMHFDLIPPTDRRLASVFDASNWAHIVNPAMYDPSSYRGDAQLPVRRYGSASEQQQIVNEALEVVLHQMDVERPYLAGLEWSLNEITDNVLNHADAPDGGLVQVATFTEAGRIQFAVADGGRGIFRSMKEGHPELRSDKEAIGEAMKQGVTRGREFGQGNGLAGAMRIATQSGGSFTVASGSGEVRIIPSVEGGPHHEERVRSRGGLRTFHGTFVFVEIRTDGPLTLETALDFGKGGGVLYDYFDHLQGEAADFVVDVANEAVGFGSRESGRGLRRKVMNMLRAEPTARVWLDWTGVPLVSSSFADEFVGRIFVELGPVQFAARVRSQAIEPVVRELVDRAILQRAAQEMK
jgi:anti-sigma regulatory factor (Ser/Thr protein kinase)